MSAEMRLAEAITDGCIRDDHDHIGDYRREVLAEVAATPVIVRRVNTSIEPDREAGETEMVVCCIAEDGRPVALLLDDEARAKLLRLLGGAS